MCCFKICKICCYHSAVWLLKYERWTTQRFILCLQFACPIIFIIFYTFVTFFIATAYMSPAIGPVIYVVGGGMVVLYVVLNLYLSNNLEHCVERNWRRLIPLVCFTPKLEKFPDAIGDLIFCYEGRASLEYALIWSESEEL